MRKIIIVLVVVFLNISGYSQSVDQLRKIDSILAIVNNTNEIVKLNRDLQNDNIRLRKDKIEDSLLKKVLEKRISELENKILQKSLKEDEITSFKKEQITLLENDINWIIKNTADLPQEILKKIYERAEILEPKNKKELELFMSMSDTLHVIKKFFEKEYDILSFQTEKKRWTFLSQQIKRQSYLFPKLNSEVVKIGDLLDEYCKNTGEIFSKFKKIYLLRNDLSNTDAFAAELKKLTYYAFDYPFLYNLINNFGTDPITQEKYKDRKVSCN